MPLTHTPFTQLLEKLNNAFNQWIEQEPRLTKFVEEVVIPSKEKRTKLKQYSLKAFQGEALSLSKATINLKKNLKLGAGEKCIKSLNKIFNILEKKIARLETLMTLASSYLNGLQLASYLEKLQQEHATAKNSINALRQHCEDETYSMLMYKIQRGNNKAFNILNSHVAEIITTYEMLNKQADDVFELKMREVVFLFDDNYQYMLHDLNSINNLGNEISIQPNAPIPLDFFRHLKKIKRDIKIEMRKPSFEFSSLELSAVVNYLKKIGVLIDFIRNNKDLNEMENLAVLVAEWAQVSIYLFANKGKTTDPQFLYMVGVLYSNLSHCITYILAFKQILNLDKLFFADSFVSISDDFFKKSLPYNKHAEQDLLFNLCIRTRLSLLRLDHESFAELANKIFQTKKMLPACKDTVDAAVFSTFTCAFKFNKSNYNVALVFAEQLQLLEKKSSFMKIESELAEEIKQVREKLTIEKDTLLNVFSSKFNVPVEKINFSYDLQGYHVFLPIKIFAENAYAISDIFPKARIAISEKRNDCSYFYAQVSIKHLLVTDIFSSGKFSGIRFMVTTISSVDAILKEVKLLLESPLVTEESILSSKLSTLTCIEKDDNHFSISITENKDIQSSDPVLEDTKNTSKKSLSVNSAFVLVPTLNGNEDIPSSYSMSESINNNNSAQSMELLRIQQISQPSINMTCKKNTNQKNLNKDKSNNNNNKNNKDNVKSSLSNVSNRNNEIPSLRGDNFGFKFSGEVTPIYSSEFTQKKRSTCFFVRWKGIKGLDINREAEFEKLLNPHPDGVITVGPLNEEGLKFYSTSLLRAKLLKKGLACKTVTAEVEETTKDNKILFALGKMKKHN